MKFSQKCMPVFIPTLAIHLAPITQAHILVTMFTQGCPPSSEDKILSDDTASAAASKGKKHPLSNKEAVRRYREKNKARVASLENEVVRLRAINQQLLKRLQGQAVLEAEISRLKCLLVDIRGRIEDEIGSFPYHKPMESGNLYQNLVNPNLRGAYVMNPCNLQCDDQVYCLNPCNLQCDDQVYCLHPSSEELNGQGLNSCGFGL